MNIDFFHKERSIFDYENSIKKEIFILHFNNLIKYHYNKSKIYKKIIDGLKFNISNYKNLENMPFLPVRLFKELELKSIDSKNIYKTLLSSGTSNTKPSKIFLDKNNSLNQIKALNQIVSYFIGNKKLPMLINDTENTLKDTKLFSARGAGIIGFSIFSSKKYFFLNEDFSIDEKLLNNFFKENKDQTFILFGFTHIIWKIFNDNINLLKKYNFSNSIIIHGGGWKKLNLTGLNNIDFNKFFLNNFKIKKIFNYYGMVEQTGSIFLECKCGNFITSKYSDIIIRDKYFNLCKDGERGIVQLFSVLPTSYPGHIILTEDEGLILEKNQCKYNNFKHFKIFGRIKKAEIRGCSDAT